MKRLRSIGYSLILAGSLAVSSGYTRADQPAAVPTDVAVTHFVQAVIRAKVGGDIGTAALDLLGAADSKEAVRQGIARMGQMLREGDATSRNRAVMALAFLGSFDKSAVGPLVTALRDEEPVIRASAADSLGTLGKGDPAVAAQAVPALQRLTRDPDANVRQNAIKAI